jgi:hypothetical protein
MKYKYTSLDVSDLNLLALCIHTSWKLGWEIPLMKCLLLELYVYTRS